MQKSSFMYKGIGTSRNEHDFYQKKKLLYPFNIYK